MPFVIACPRCERKLQVPETTVGAAVRCPACRATFTAPPVPEEVTSTAPASSEERPLANAITLDVPEGTSQSLPAGTEWTGRDAWRRVHSGLGYIVVGLLVGLAVLLLDWLPCFAMAVGSGPGSDDDLFWHDERTVVILLGRSGGLTLLFSSICVMAGLLRCLMYPVRGAGPILALFAFALCIIWTAGRILGPTILTEMDNNAPTSPYMVACRAAPEERLAPFLGLLGLFQQVVLVLFLREIGRDCRDEAVLNRLRWWFVFLGGLVAVALVATSTSSYFPTVLFTGLVVLQAQLIRLAAAARRATASCGVGK
jgi:hypothetical protein